MPAPTLASVQAYVDARRLGSLRDVLGVPLWSLPADIADELRELCEHVAPIAPTLG